LAYADIIAEKHYTSFPSGILHKVEYNYSYDGKHTAHSADINFCCIPTFC